MAKNEHGDEIPGEIEQQAKEMGCRGGVKYVYLDGQYHGKPPVASLGRQKANRFRHLSPLDRYKEKLAEGYVAFWSPQAVDPPFAEGKPRGEPCLVCGEDRVTSYAHFPNPKRSGGQQVIPLCWTHHHLLDSGRLSDAEFMAIHQSRFAHLGAAGVTEFVNWAHEQGYRYSHDALNAKAIRGDGAGPRQISYQIENFKTPS